MQEAYILITVEPGCEGQVRQDLKKIGGVKEVYASYGVYDFIGKVGAESTEQLRELVFDQLRKIENVRATLTLIVSENNIIRRKTMEDRYDQFKL